MTGRSNDESAITATPPSPNTVNLLNDALYGLLTFSVSSRGRESLDFLQESDEVVRVPKQDLIQLPQSAGGLIHETLAAVDRIEPVG
jgi:hypothetical protein